MLRLICGMHYSPLLANVILWDMPYAVVAIGYSLGILGVGQPVGMTNVYAI